VDPLTAGALEGRHVAVIGGSGYVGRLLLPALLAAGAAVRAIARVPSDLSGMPGIQRVRVPLGDTALMAEALAGQDLAFDVRHGAPAYAGGEAAEVGRVVALRCLADPPGGAPPGFATEIRSGPIIGAGSPTMRALRRMAERLPVLAYPRSRARSQPVAAGDLVPLLVLLAIAPEAAGRVVEAGGPDVLTLGELVEGVAEAVGRRPRPASLHLGPTGASALALRLVAGVDADAIRVLLADAVVTGPDAASLVPFTPLPFATAVRAALAPRRRN
jgi:uncharacterized protein YbjT (DUF2867 family)